MKNEKVVKKRKKMSSIKKLFICIVLALLIVDGFYIYNNFIKIRTSAKKPKVVDEIKSFEYTVNEKDTKLYKSTFNELKKVLTAKKVDEEKYAETIAKLFVIDFFSLENKTSKNDIGGVQFVFSSYKKDFVDYAREGIYKQVKNNIDSGKKQDLPLVDEVEIKKTDKIVPSQVFQNEAVSSDTEEDGYEIEVEWSYKDSDDFQTHAVLTIIKDGTKLSVAKMDK